MTKPRPSLDPPLTGSAGAPDADTDLLDAGPASKDQGLRQCCVTRERLPRAELIRFVCAPDGTVTPDLAERLPGRGVWVKADRAVIQTAARKGAFARAFKHAVIVPDALADRVTEGALNTCKGLLGLARKAGQVVTGFEQVREALYKRRPGLLLAAYDGARDGRQKIEALAFAQYGDLPIREAMSSDELGDALGRDRVIHVLVRAGAMAHRLKAVYERLERLRPPSPAPVKSASDEAET